MRSSASGSAGGAPSPRHKKFLELLDQNRQWAAERKKEDPQYFERLQSQQAPEYLWIGCADSRVPANVILGLAPGEVFVQRNVGNQALHTDMNCMSCLEYAVKELKVKTVIVCGHYGCGAVKAGLRLPSKTPGLVNNWITDIRDCRNQHYDELRALKADGQLDRLCELNVIRQTFNVCTSQVVQEAWDKGQDLTVFGVVYSLKDGRLHVLVGPLSSQGEITDPFEMLDPEQFDFSSTSASFVSRLRKGHAGAFEHHCPVTQALSQALNTAHLTGKLEQHNEWSQVEAPSNAEPMCKSEIGK